MNAGRHLHRCKRRKAPLVVRLSSCALQCAKKGVCYTENMKLTHELRSLSDDELLRHLSKIIQESRRVEADLIAHIAEVDERRLYAREACSSMHVYCTEVLHLSDAEAYSRIGAARHSRMFPALLTMLEDGRLHLSAIALLSPHLTEENWERVLARAVHKSKHQIEKLVAELAPKPDVPPAIRKLPARTSPAPQLRPDVVKNEMPPAPAAAPHRNLPSSRRSRQPATRCRSPRAWSSGTSWSARKP